MMTITLLGNGDKPSTTPHGRSGTLACVRRNPQKLTAFKNVTMAALRFDLVQYYRIWLLARRSFPGRAPLREFKAFVRDRFGYSIRQCSRLVFKPNPFWRRAFGKSRASRGLRFIVLSGVKSVHEHFALETGVAVYLNQALITDKLQAAKANLLYSVLPEPRNGENVPISRDKIEVRTGVSGRQQRRYHQVLRKIHGPKLIRKNFEEVRQLTKGEQVLRSSGNQKIVTARSGPVQYLVRQLPNSYLRVGGDWNRAAERRLKKQLKSQNKGVGQHWLRFFCTQSSDLDEGTPRVKFFFPDTAAKGGSQLWRLIQ